ncbi:unnamed protein product [Bursaphelenchus xylophilus]|uniref:(pine wood nematode) hypothetical protein n=1 Tax=Bursaphelenchus xylophilus TaxID=6326 RepID=A0A1I7RZ45_BURXY|nr:unnamed protein product [Bursaphelenchus xylophilus]CAG9106868.1 unnamed protein product [Bursaphelenchus xylophilus]
MLAPIVTKDMKLFPSRPLPPRIKNVRSRAQSLQDFADANARKQQVQQQQKTRQRNAQSVGNLASGKGSPPKGSIIKRKPLDAIAEGVEMAPPLAPTTASTPAMCQSSFSTCLASPSSPADEPTPERHGKLAKYPVVDLARKNDENRPESVMSTVSSCPSTSGDKLERNSSARSSTKSTDSSKDKTPITAGLLKFITNSLKGSKKERKCHQEAKKRSEQQPPASPTVP